MDNSEDKSRNIKESNERFWDAINKYGQEIKYNSTDFLGWIIPSESKMLKFYSDVYIEVVSYSKKYEYMDVLKAYRALYKADLEGRAWLLNFYISVVAVYVAVESYLNCSNVGDCEKVIFSIILGGLIVLLFLCTGRQKKASIMHSAINDAIESIEKSSQYTVTIEEINTSNKSGEEK